MQKQNPIRVHTERHLQTISDKCVDGVGGAAGTSSLRKREGPDITPNRTEEAPAGACSLTLVRPETRT